MEHDEIIAVVQAHKDGKDIQFFNRIDKRWNGINPPAWDFASHDYRVKPEPREWDMVLCCGSMCSCDAPCDEAEKVKVREVL